MFQLSENLTLSFAHAVLKTYDLSSFSIDMDSALLYIQDSLNKRLTSLNSQTAKNKRWKRFQVPHTTPEDYAERVLPLENGHHVLCGIRHLNLNPVEPFVDILPNFPVENLTEYQKIYQQIKGFFTVFDPKYLRRYTTEEAGDNTGSIYMVQRVNIIQNLPAWPEESSFELQRVENDSYFPWYEKGYHEFFNRRPELKDRVSLNSLEVMEDSRKENLLFYMMINNRRAGLIAAKNTPFLGHSGFYFNEIFISSDFLGKGMAKAFQRKIIQHYCPPEAIVWGTINAQNIPSLRTAQANQRKKIRFESFLSIKSKPKTKVPPIKL